MMNIFHFSLSCVLALPLPFLLVDSTNAQVTILSRSSFVNSSDIFFDGGGPSQMDFFEGSGVYNESRVVGNIQTSQFSSIIDGSFDIQTSAQGGNSSIEEGFTESISIFRSEFSVPVASEFTLTGMLERDDSESSSSLELSGDDLQLSFFSRSSSLINTSGILLPNVIYVLEVNSTSLGNGVSDLTDRRTSAVADLTITAISVPEPSTIFPLIALTIAGACRRSRRKNQLPC